MKSGYIYRMAFRNISRNKKRTALSAFAIAMAVMIVCFMKSYTTGLFNNVKNNVFSFETAHVKVINKDYLKEEKLMPLDLNIYGYENNYNEVIDLLKKIEGIKYVLPRTKFGAILNLNGKMKNLVGFALDQKLEYPVNPLKDKIIAGRMFNEYSPGVQEIVIGEILAREIGVKSGDKITLMTKTAEDGLGHMTFKISGISSYGISEFDKTYFYIPLSAAAKFLKMENEVIELAVYLDNMHRSIPVSKKINEQFYTQQANPYIAYPWEYQKDGQYYKMFVTLTKTYDIIFIGIIFLACLVIINTTMMVIYERMKEIGTIAALGMRGTAIIKLFFYESVIISAMGSFTGTVIGGAISLYLSITGINIAKLTGGGMNLQFSEIVYPRFGLDILLYSFIFGVLISSVCVFIPATKAAKIEPAEAMRGIL
ncbi:MAG: hypothetical protein A2252_11605 [Elusimicrobia bacterium RIFOXYA2_FULL_39_19]|nr:MAG: hypothetical protein A2252_11605 [Elusimicrobia bacterium RIFOXYA2_FULL_39_19]